MSARLQLTFDFDVGNVLELTALMNSCNEIIVHHISANQIKCIGDNDRTTTSVIECILTVVLNRIECITGSTPYFNRIVVQEVQLTCESNRIYEICTRSS